MDTKEFILNEIYKTEIAKFTKEDFIQVKTKIQQWADKQYQTLIQLSTEGEANGQQAQ